MEKKSDQALLLEAEAWMREHRSELVADLIKMINYPSVSRPGDGGYAFGADCKACADAMLELAGSYGFDTENDDYYTISILDRKDSGQEMGILGHLDVVPAGNGWHYEPFRAIEKDGFVIGRGSGDNKGGVLMSLYVMRFLREQGVGLKHTVRLICGFNEEAGMQDVEHYLKYHKAPAYTLVCDGGWAACIGEKGIMNVTLCQQVQSGNLKEMTGGTVSNAVPDFCTVRLSGVAPEKWERACRDNPELEYETADGMLKITVRGKAGHAAFPEYGENAVYKAARFLQKYELLEGGGAAAVKNIAECFIDDYGTGLDIDFEDEISGKTTCVGSVLSMKDGELSLKLDIRFAIRQEGEELVKRLEETCRARGIRISDLHYSNPRYTDPGEPIPAMLLSTCREILGEEYQPYVMGGGTHARKFPNALPYGPMGIHIENPYGSAHGPDEAMPVEGLTASFPVYVLALARLDRMLI